MLRLREARKAKGLTQVEVSRIIGISQNGYSDWETGKNRVDARSLGRLAELYGVTVNYLLGIDENDAPAKGVRIPVLGSVAAGIPIEAIQDIVDYEEIDADMAAAGEYFGLRIKGSSMEPRIREGDVVIVRRQEEAETGDTVVVLVNGDSATVKRIKIEPNGIAFSPDETLCYIAVIPNNPAYDTRFYSAAEVELLPVRIIGKVVELRGKL